MDAVYFGRKPESNSTEEFHIDLHGSSNNFIRLAIRHIKLIVNMFNQFYQLCNVFTLYLFYI